MDEKFHCSQAVLGAFAEKLGITKEQALKLGVASVEVCAKEKYVVLLQED